MSSTTATPAVRPFSSMHNDSKVVTDSTQRKLDRKRANARIRQQRCRARKRARAQEQEKNTFESKQIKQDVEALRSLGNRNHDLKPKLPGARPVTGRYWQPPPPPPPGHDQEGPKHAHKPVNRPVVPAAGAGGAWKTHAQTSISYQSAAAYYTHQQQAAAYSSWYGAWSQAAAAAYYGQHGMHMHQGYPPPHGHTVPSTTHKLPPASPLQLLSPMRNKGEIKEATTPYFEVEDIVKSPMRSLPPVESTPSAKKPHFAYHLASPESGLLPPLWSTAKKPTPGSASRSPWSAALPSPSLMTNTPAADWDWTSSYEQRETPALPLTTPIKTAGEIESWLYSGTPSK